METNKRPLARVLRLLGYLFSVGLPLAATLSCFPLWRERGSASVLAGGTLLLIALCVLPLWRTLKAHLKSPAAWCIWLFAFLLFSLIGSIIYEMRIICFFGLVGNLAGALCFFLARVRK